MRINTRTNLIIPREEPFKVDLVADAKCQERVFATKVPKPMTLSKCVNIKAYELILQLKITKNHSMLRKSAT